MTRNLTRRQRTLTRGLTALAKTLLLVAGVPVAGYRLWRFSTSQTYPAHVALAIDLVLGAVAVVWVVAVTQLAIEIFRAARSPEEAPRHSWSGSWAAGIVGLLLLAGALSMHNSPPRHATPIVQTLRETSSPRVTLSKTRQSHTVAEALALGLGALISAGVLDRTRRLRRLRNSMRSPGSRIASPTDEVQVLTQKLHATEQPRLIDWIETTNRILGRHFIQRASGAGPDIALLRIGSDGIDLLLRAPMSVAPAPFRTSQGGLWWHLDPLLAHADLEEILDTFPRYIPALIPVGNDGTGEVLIAVRPGQLFGIVGDDEEVDATFSAMLLALRSLPWCDELAVEILGTEAPPLEEQSVHLQQSNPQTIEMLCDAPSISRLEMKATWRREPMVAAHRRAVHDGDAKALLSHAKQLGAIVGGAHGDVTLFVSKGHATLAPYGISLIPHVLHHWDVPLVDRLIAAFAQPADVIALHEAPVSDEVSCEIEISILGTRVDVIGAQRRPNSVDEERVHELLVYLCTHDHQAPRGAILEDMFPFALPSHERRLENIIATTRAMLGRAHDGREYLRIRPDGVVELDRTVALDWHALASDIARADTLEGPQAVEALYGILGSLDASHLLDSVAGYCWLQAMGLPDDIRARLLDACHHLATLAQSTGNPRTVEMALTTGLAIEPGSETIVRDLMVHADETGQRDQIHAIYRNLEETLNALGGAEPTSVTHRLYLELTSPRGAARD